MGGPATQEKEKIARVFMIPETEVPMCFWWANSSPMPTPAGPPRATSASTAQGRLLATAGGFHHALVTAYYGKGDTRPVSDPVGTITTHDRHALLVPAGAVQTVEGKPSVFVRVPQGFKAIPVALGQPSGNAVTILSGLSGREQIAVANSFTLKAELGKSEAVDED